MNEELINHPELAELMRAFSARVRLIGAHARRGELPQIIELVEQMERVLPLPAKNNWQAAKNCAARVERRKDLHEIPGDSGRARRAK